MLPTHIRRDGKTYVQAAKYSPAALKLLRLSDKTGAAAKKALFAALQDVVKTQPKVLEERDPQGTSLMYYMAGGYHVPTYQLLLKQPKVGKLKNLNNGRTPLHQIAATAFETPAVLELVAQHPDALVVDKRGETPLYEVLRHALHGEDDKPEPKLAALVARRPGFAELRNHDGTPLLHLLARRLPDVALMVPGVGTVVDEEYGDTGLHVIAGLFDSRIPDQVRVTQLEQVLTHPDAKSVKNRRGRTAYEIAEEQLHLYRK
jgi:hypothetical protein